MVNEIKQVGKGGEHILPIFSSGHIDLDTLIWGEYGTVPHPQRGRYFLIKNRIRS